MSSSNSTRLTRAEREKHRLALREKLLTYKFTHFVTLATNGRPFGEAKMRSLLKEWDARVNRELNGPKWTKRPDERLVWFAFPELFDGNPHWHLVIEVDPAAESDHRAQRYKELPEICEKHWIDLIPSGTVDVKDVYKQGVIMYVTKMSAEKRYFESYILYREFMTT